MRPTETHNFLRTAIHADMRRAFLLGLGTGIVLGWGLTLCGFAAGWILVGWWSL
jgi:hypothetical protein